MSRPIRGWPWNQVSGIAMGRVSSTQSQQVHGSLESLRGMLLGIDRAHGPVDDLPES